MTTFPRRNVLAGYLPLIALLLTAGLALANAPVLHLRMVDQQIQLGTDAKAPAYYVQYRSPTTEWQTWTSKSILPDSQSGAWFFRAIFETNPEDPMEWDLAADVDQVLTQSSAIETTADQLYWSIIGEFDTDGTFVAAYDKNPDPMMTRASTAEPPPVYDSEAPQNNQAVAVPDPGRVRLYWRNQSSNRAFIWHLSDSGERKSGIAVHDVNLASGWIIAGTGDINGNGIQDLVWYNTGSGRVFIWFLEVDGLRSSGQLVSEAYLSTAWRIEGVDDIDGDGYADLIWRNRDTNRAFIWFLNADGTRRDGQAVHPENLSAGWEIAGIADINTNGTPDIVWRNRNTNRAFIWFLNADGTRRDGQAVHPENLSAGWEIAGIADIDGDGTPDLVWRNRNTNRAFIWFLNADGTRRDGQLVSEAYLAMAWDIAGVVDVDEDNIPDIVWRNRSTNRVFVWFLNADGTRRDGQSVSEAYLATAWGIDSVNH